MGRIAVFQDLMIGGLAIGLALTLGACRAERPEAPMQTAPVTPAPTTDRAPVTPPAETGDLALKRAIAGTWREFDGKRDVWRHPYETLEFFGLKPGMTVVEVWPGGGWYTRILAPYLRETGGQLIVAHFDPATAKDNPFVRSTLENFKLNYLTKPAIYGTPTLSALGAKTGPIAPEGTADLVVTFRNAHNWMNAQYAEKTFKDMYDVLKPGGRLGVVEHRASPNKPQDPLAASGYVRESTIKDLAKQAGFKFVGASEINANPKDTKDHPFGVWTLPPVLRSAPAGKPDDPAFDKSPYEAIGESDRMTLVFRKPIPEK